MQDTDVPREDSDVPARPHTGQDFSSANRIKNKPDTQLMGNGGAATVLYYYGMFVSLSIVFCAEL